MKVVYKELLLAVGAVLSALILLDMFGIAEQGSLNIAHRGTLGRKAVNVKEKLVGESAGLYQNA